jgi:hypothetical protein
VPGRGDALIGRERCRIALAQTKDFVTELYGAVEKGSRAGRDLKAVYADTVARLRPKFGTFAIFDHCMPFDVSRAYDEAAGIEHPRIWTAARDAELWQALEGVG